MALPAKRLENRRPASHHEGDVNRSAGRHSFMEDYTYHFDNGDDRSGLAYAGSLPDLSPMAEQTDLDVQPLGIGGKPIRPA